ncbi:Uncharacterised protein [Mycobacteroides abscessus subsp. abscessus]|nr:Uncharacterised protein [Mycobacteroides abscessus subsp. abscessus]
MGFGVGGGSGTGPLPTLHKFLSARLQLVEVLGDKLLETPSAGRHLLDVVKIEGELRFHVSGHPVSPPVSK